MMSQNAMPVRHAPWNKGKLVGQKAPLKLKDIWVIRVRLELGDRRRELALFNLAIDSKLRGCVLFKLKAEMSRMVITSRRAPLSCNRKPSVPFNLKLPSPPENPCWHGSAASH